MRCTSLPRNPAQPRMSLAQTTSRTCNRHRALPSRPACPLTQPANDTNSALDQHFISCICMATRQALSSLMRLQQLACTLAIQPQPAFHAHDQQYLACSSVSRLCSAVHGKAPAVPAHLPATTMLLHHSTMRPSPEAVFPRHRQLLLPPTPTIMAIKSHQSNS